MTPDTPPRRRHRGPWLLPLLALLFGAAGYLLLEGAAGPLDAGAAAVVLWAGLTFAAAAGLWWRERRRLAAEEEARQARSHLHQAQKLEAVGRLAGGVAHDINNYLAVIRSHCEAVLERRPPRDEVEEKMRTVVAAVLKASSLVERLLAFGRRQPSRPELVSLNDVVETFVGVARGSLRDVELATRLAPEPWPVEVDVSQIEQVVANLFVNARDATPAGGRIEIATANRAAGGTVGVFPGPQDGDWVELAVADTGVGIPPEIQESVFEPFFTTKERHGSTGLGLSTVFGVVHQAGGRVELESAPGAGTTFRILLPRSGRGPAPLAASPERDLLEGTENVLLVDDNRELAAAVAAYLGDLGYRVTVCADETAARTAALTADEPFDAVVCDVQLGTGSGVDLVADLRATAPPPAAGGSLRAVYMTGYTGRVELRRMSRDDEAFFVKKPFSMQGLARMVRQVLDSGLEVEG